MKFYFSFDNESYNFWPIYNGIIHFYPLGIPKNTIYYEYPGIKKLEEAITLALSDNSNFSQSWSNLIESVKTKLNKNMVGTTYGQAPSFSSYVLLDEYIFSRYIIQKELHFAVSLIGPFFTVYGVDKVNFTDFNNLIYNEILAVTCSPYEEYQESFNLVKSNIESLFSSFKFVPYGINALFVEGLYTRYSDNRENTVYNALFNDFIFNGRYESKLRGDDFFGYDEWSIKRSSDSIQNWSIFPPKD